MTETTVAYHVEDGESRPAINVKDYHAGIEYETRPYTLAIEAAIPGSGGHLCMGGRDLRADAYARVVSDFWQAATEIAEQRGLGEIEQAGRSGGWLVFTDGRDPRMMSGGEWRDPEDADPEDAYVQIAVEERADWLAAYRSMVEWADAWIADAPRKVRDLAQGMAMDEAGANTVAVRAWLAFGKEYAL